MAVRFLLVAASLAAAASAGEAGALRGADAFSAAAPESYANLTDVLTPPNATQPIEVLMALRQLLDERLRSEHFQWLVTAITFGSGVAMLVSPKGSFKYLIIAVVFGVTYTIAMANAQDRYLREHPDAESGPRLWEISLSFEIAACAAVVAWNGFEGLELFIAMLLSVYPLRLLQTCLVGVGIFGASPWWNIIVVTASAGIGIFFSFDHRLEQLLAYVCPVIGGRLVSSSFGWFLFYVFEHTWSKAWLDFWHSLPLDVDNPSAPHIRQALTGAPQVGWSTPTGAGPQWAGAALGTVLWLILAAAGVFYNHRAVAQKRVASQKWADQPRLSTSEASQVLLRRSQLGTPGFPSAAASAPAVAAGESQLQ